VILNLGTWGKRQQEEKEVSKGEFHREKMGFGVPGNSVQENLVDEEAGLVQSDQGTCQQRGEVC